MIGEKWSWGVRGIYRNLENAIDDMRILSTSIICNGVPNRAGFVMGNPGDPLTIFTDTNCDGVSDAFVTIDLERDGWASFSGNNGAGTFLGRISGFPDPKRTYKALEFVLDRAWDDKWSLNASYTLSYAEGNAEGPVNSDFNFADSGRTEAFDDPYVNLRRRWLSAERSSAPDQIAWCVCADAELAVRRNAGSGIGSPQERVRSRQSHRWSGLPQLLCLHEPLRRARFTRFRAEPARLGGSHSMDLRHGPERHVQLWLLGGGPLDQACRIQHLQSGRGD